MASKENHIEYLKDKSVPKEEFISLQTQLQTELLAKDNELQHLRDNTVPREDYINLQNELRRKEDRIKRLEEINDFFNELQEEEDSFETQEVLPPFKLEKKQRR